MAMHLKAARVNAGLTQSEVREILNSKGYAVALSTIVNWEAERTFPPVPLFKLLCDAYGCRMDDIFVPETLT